MALYPRPMDPAFAAWRYWAAQVRDRQGTHDHVSTEDAAQAGEPGDLPEVREELLDLVLELVDVALAGHLQQGYPGA